MRSSGLFFLLLLLPSTTSFLPYLSRREWCSASSRSPPLPSTNYYLGGGGDAGAGSSTSSGSSTGQHLGGSSSSSHSRNVAMAAAGSQQQGGGSSSAVVPIILTGGSSAQRSSVAKALSSMMASRAVHTVAEGDKHLKESLDGSSSSSIIIDYSGSREQALAVTTAGGGRAAGVVVNLVEYGNGNGHENQCAAGGPSFDVAVGSGPTVKGSVVSVSPEEAAQEVIRQYHFIIRPPATKKEVDLMMGTNTFFLSLTYPEVADLLPILSGLEKGVDALELRVDLLQRQDEWSVLQQVALLKRHSSLPIIFTVRSKGQVGAFPDDPEALFALLRLGLRAGVEVLDVEANWPRHYRNDLIGVAGPYRGRTLLLGSYHVVGKATSDDEARQLFRECYHDGDVDAVKVVLTAMEVRDSYRVHGVAASLDLPVPIIALCLGEKGKLSRVLNTRYTPVTSSLLPTAAAPGQLTSSTIMHLRHSLGIIPSKTFYLLGYPITYSPSPAMHNSAFQQCQLPHNYTKFETQDVATFEATIRSADFGGASVTIPHKETIGQYIDRVEPAAKVIGAINTIVPETDPSTGKVTLVGDNTDWTGILVPVKEMLIRHKGGAAAGGAALVIGGGGTSLAAAYAMTQLGLKVLVYNRTPSKAVAVASRFDGVALEVLTPEAVKQALGGDGGAGLQVIVSTIPAAAEFTVPPELLSTRPVVMDAAYKPAQTALLTQARQAGCPFIQGAEMLINQGVEQFQRWTLRQAPVDAMRTGVYSLVDRIME